MPPNTPNCPARDRSSASRPAAKRGAREIGFGGFLIVSHQKKNEAGRPPSLGIARTRPMAYHDLVGLYLSPGHKLPDRERLGGPGLRVPGSESAGLRREPEPGLRREPEPG